MQVCLENEILTEKIAAFQQPCSGRGLMFGSCQPAGRIHCNMFKFLSESRPIKSIGCHTNKLWLSAWWEGRSNGSSGAVFMLTHFRLCRNLIKLIFNYFLQTKCEVGKRPLTRLLLYFSHLMSFLKDCCQRNQQKTHEFLSQRKMQPG